MVKSYKEYLCYAKRHPAGTVCLFLHKRSKKGGIYSMKVMIVGAGGQGGACASILARQDAIEEIRLWI